MPERYSITRINPDLRDPTFSLAIIVSNRLQGAVMQLEATGGNTPHPLMSLTVDSDNRDYAQRTWDKLTGTKEFTCLQSAYAGDTAFFRETAISSSEFILTDRPNRFYRFYDFLRALAYDRAIDLAQRQEDHYRVKELKLESRGNWTPRFKWYQKPFVPRHIESILTRVYNLVTTGEEQLTMRDRVLDLIMR